MFSLVCPYGYDMELTGEESMSSNTDLLLANSVLASSLETEVREVCEYPISVEK
jgi:hypothetical protein